MQNSLFIQNYSQGIAFYINGDLQFDTFDEAIYHEFLVIPAIALAIHRFPHIDLQVLICGGGDGLAVRDGLRFTEVSSIDLVDYNPEVVELAKSVFSSYNQQSLENNKTKIYLQEAFEFLTTIPDKFYHVIICDFTYPNCMEDTKIYSKEWFEQINRVLVDGGVMSTNGVSPENRTTGFWCLYQTLLAAELKAKPLQVSIPSFQEHGYGKWGFFLASKFTINQTEIGAIKYPKNLKFLSHDKLIKSGQFSQQIAEKRHDVIINTIACPQLIYYLLNPLSEKSNLPLDKIIDFWEIDESKNYLSLSKPSLDLESITQVWLEQYSKYLDLDTQGNALKIDLSQLLPRQHRYHTAEMAQEQLHYLQELLRQIDGRKLLKNMQEKANLLPPQIGNKINNLFKEITTKNSRETLSPRLVEFITVLSLILLLSNFSHPDGVFAKGYTIRGSQPDSNSTDGFDLKTFGAMLLFGGWIWLTQILSNQDNE
jgi:spermidine synthase